MFQSWAEATAVSLEQVWAQMLAFVPQLLGMTVVFVVGLVVASVLSHLVERALNAIKLNQVVAQTGVDKEFARAGINFDLAKFFSKLLYWLVLIVTIVLVTNNLFGQDTAANLLMPLFDFIPKVAAAVIILLGAVVLANFLRNVIQAAVVGARLHAPKFVATVAWWSVTIFGFIAALRQLGIGDFIVSIASTVITAAVFGTALAFALAFGLGLKDHASGWLSKWKGMMDK